MSSSPRAYITERISELIPAGVKLDPGIPTLGTLSQPVAWIEYTSFGPLPEAPVAAVGAVAALCIASHHADLTKAQADIDEKAWSLYIALAEQGEFYAITATKEVFEDTYLGWRISLTIAYTDTETEEPTP